MLVGASTSCLLEGQRITTRRRKYKHTPGIHNLLLDSDDLRKFWKNGTACGFGYLEDIVYCS